MDLVFFIKKKAFSVMFQKEKHAFKNTAKVFSNNKK